MGSTDSDSDFRSETFSSPALFSGEYLVKEEITKSHDSSFGGRRAKALLVPKLLWLFQHTPPVITMLPVRFIILLLRALYVLPQNPWRQSCEYICKIAERAGHSHRPSRVYQQLLSNMAGAVYNYSCLYGHGYEAALARVTLADEDGERLNRLAEEHGGVMVMVAHNFDTVFSMLKLDTAVPLLPIVRNPATIERTRAALDCYERMKVTVIMVRGGNPIELSRTLFSVLKKGNIVVAPVDLPDRSKARVEIEMFGKPVGLPNWAAKIAARRQVPVVPAYISSSAEGSSFAFGEHIISEDVEEVMRHYTRYFEQGILRDPASWAFLADKSWIKILRRISRDAA